jgi:hypothetical protein
VREIFNKTTILSNETASAYQGNSRQEFISLTSQKDNHCSLISAAHIKIGADAFAHTSFDPLSVSSLAEPSKT